MEAALILWWPWSRSAARRSECWRLLVRMLPRGRRRLLWHRVSVPGMLGCRWPGMPLMMQRLVVLLLLGSVMPKEVVLLEHALVLALL